MILLLATIFRLVVIPVQFEDREFASVRSGQERLVAEAEAYFNRQYGEEAFRFELAPAVTLSREVAWYGADNPDRRDVHLADAVKEACAAVQGQIELPETVLLLYAGTGQHESGQANDIYPQQGKTNSGITFAAECLDDGLVADLAGRAFEFKMLHLYCFKMCYSIWLGARSHCTKTLEGFSKCDAKVINYF